MNIISLEINHRKQKALIPEYIATAVDSDLLLYFREQKVFTSLNSSASSLWKIMERHMNRNQTLTEDEIYSTLASSYPDLTAEQAVEAMLSLCAQLASAEALKWE